MCAVINMFIFYIILKSTEIYEAGVYIFTRNSQRNSSLPLSSLSKVFKEIMCLSSHPSFLVKINKINFTWFFILIPWSQSTQPNIIFIPFSPHLPDFFSLSLSLLSILNSNGRSIGFFFYFPPSRGFGFWEWVSE